MVQDLKTSKVSQWYSKIKRMSSTDPTKDEKIIVQEIKDLPSEQQAKIIADKYSEISNLYKPLRSEDIALPTIENSKPYPLYQPHQIHNKI